MVDVFEVAKLLVSHAVANYGGDVDLIATYGSQARGDARPGSDLDIFYTPAPGKNPPIGRTFLLDGLLFDFWALRWETLEGFATGTLRGWAFAPALVRQATPLYVRSSEQADRLAALQRQSRALEEPEHRAAMHERAQECFVRVVEQLGILRLAAQGSSADLSHAAWRLIQANWECLSLANQVTFERGFHRALNETEKLTNRPEGLKELVRTITTSPDASRVLEAADALVGATYRILHEHDPAQPLKRSVGEAFDQVYPEMKDILRKLLTACEAGDRVAASLEAYSLQHDVTSILADTREAPIRRRFDPYSAPATAYSEAGFPDLMTRSTGSLDGLADAARRFDAHLRSWLAHHGVDLCEFDTLDELRSVLR